MPEIPGKTAASPTSSPTVPTARPRNESLASAGVVSLAGAGLASALGYVITAVIGRGWGTTGAGEVFGVIAVFTILSNVLELGADTGLVRFTARLRALGQIGLIRPTIRSALTTVVLVSLPVLAVAAWLVPGLRAVVVCVLCATLVQVLLSGARGLGRVLPYALVANVGLPVVRLALVVGALVAGLGTSGALAAWALPFLLLVGPAALVLGRAVRRTESGQQVIRPDPEERAGAVREFWRFSSVRGVAAAVEVVLEWSDVLLLGLLVGSAEAGIYAVVTRCVRAGQIVDQAVRVAVSPEVSAAIAVDDQARAGRIYTEVARMMILLQWPFYLLLAVFGPLVLSLFGTGFDAGAPAMAIMAVAMMVAAAAGMVQTFLLMGGRSHWQLVNKGVVLALSVGTNIVVMPVFGLTGAACTWALATLADVGLGLWRVRGGLGIRARGRSLLGAAALPLVIVGGGGLLARQVVGTDGWACLAAVLVILVTYLTGCLALRRMLGIDGYLAKVGRAVRRRGGGRHDGPPQEDTRAEGRQRTEP